MEYAIRIGNRYYTGKAGDGWLSENVADAFLYTEEGANAKIRRMKWNATAEKVR